ncbi:uncharacterized protein LOC107409286 isoform X4 [Ziziphus jujuba]|uniref:Uncharacterized protein LOC107409286 isoform X4 n=1 Tax=Ziziphus jujuba TaxID=326968 RepID=A0ABM4ACS8_ZIZJJ|nr:uncharacterized protein LOC107409286 isoform X4 [Ziziphus jujuba]XP_060674545.1 uncharacterized protein LOC107409286 isoform X4 [Ziziphus jujuba]
MGRRDKSTRKKTTEKRNTPAVVIFSLSIYSSLGPSNQSYLTSKLKPSIPNEVTCIYKAELSTSRQLLIMLTWQKSLNINISEKPSSQSKLISRFKSLEKKKGNKAFQFCNFKIEVFWDISTAMYDKGPEPINGFYFVVFVDSELGLLLGDKDDDEIFEMKKMKTGIQKAKFLLVSRSEQYSGNAVYSTKAKFCDTGTEHEIVIKCGREYEGYKSSVFCVFIDQKVIFQVERLRWNFRGQEAGCIAGYGWKRRFSRGKGMRGLSFPC